MITIDKQELKKELEKWADNFNIVLRLENSKYKIVFKREGRYAIDILSADISDTTLLLPWRKIGMITIYDELLLHIYIKNNLLLYQDIQQILRRNEINFSVINYRVSGKPRAMQIPIDDIKNLNCILDMSIDTLLENKGI